MNFFLDTEFIDGADKLDLISIALVGENGKEYYAVSNEFDESKASEWVKQHVLTKLPPKSTWKSRATIGKEIRSFIDKNRSGEYAEFYAYFASCDWILFYKLFGNSLLDLPDGYFQFCHDLMSLMHLNNISRPKPPKGNHDALVDARWNLSVFKHIQDKLKYTNAFQRIDR
jgi:hypothetical protein